VRRAEKPGDLARELDHVVHHVRQGHERRKAGALGEFVTQDRAEAGRVVAIVRQEFEVALRGGAAAQRGEGGRVVVRHRMVQAADDRQPVDDPRRVRQVLADPDPGHIGRDRPKLAPDLSRGVGLHVPGIKVARPAVVEDQDAGTDGGGRATALPRRGHAGAEPTCEIQPECAKAAAEEPAAAIERKARGASQFMFPAHGSLPPSR
jgi:hypothetical protein